MVRVWILLLGLAPIGSGCGRLGFATEPDAAVDAAPPLALACDRGTLLAADPGTLVGLTHFAAVSDGSRGYVTWIDPAGALRIVGIEAISPDEVRVIGPTTLELGTLEFLDIALASTGPIVIGRVATAPPRTAVHALDLELGAVRSAEQAEFAPYGTPSLMRSGDRFTAVGIDGAGRLAALRIADAPDLTVTPLPVMRTAPLWTLLTSVAVSGSPTGGTLAVDAGQCYIADITLGDQLVVGAENGGFAMNCSSVFMERDAERYAIVYQSNTMFYLSVAGVPNVALGTVTSAAPRIARRTSGLAEQFVVSFLDQGRLRARVVTVANALLPGAAVDLADNVAIVGHAPFVLADRLMVSYRQAGPDPGIYLRPICP